MTSGIWIIVDLLVILAAIGLVFAIVIYRYTKRVKLEAPSQRLTRVKYPTPISHKDLKKTKDQIFHATWQTKMQQHAYKMKTAGVEGVVFIHGTFTGNDPFEIVPVLKNILPEFLSDSMQDKINALIKGQSNKLFKDIANFSPEYIKTFDIATKESFTNINCFWSSGNHHMARVRGAFQVITSLCDAIELGKIHLGKRVLLLAHSHGGQLLALLSNIVFNPKWRQTFLNIMRDRSDYHQFVGTTQRAQKYLKSIRFDCVSLGTPYRYRYHPHRNIHVMHLLNHRVDEFAPLNPKGILYTTDGDYPQKWGLSGTDFLAPTKEDRISNRRLDEILDIGIDVRNLKSNIETQDYLPQFGHTVLVDYQDQGRDLTPNCVATMFGHGIYTSLLAMEFNLNLIVHNLY